MSDQTNIKTADVPSVDSQTPCYARFPVYLNKNTCALIQIFTKYDDPDDAIWIAECWPDFSDHKGTAEFAAKQFVDQLKDHWTPRFLKALKDEIDARLSGA